jgi:hypothetical protein
MAATKVKDLVVKLREYQDRDGNKKAQWHTIGSLMRGDDGNEFLLLDRHFNPAGVPNPDNRGNVLVSMFDPKQDDRAQGGQQSAQTTQQSRASDMDQEIPF